MKTIRLPAPWTAIAAVALLLASAAARPARADFQLINNGGFEAGFAGWTRQDFLGSDGTFSLQTGTTSPVNHDPVPAPPGGLNAAMTDAQGRAARTSSTRTSSCPPGVTPATLQFSLFVGNRATSPTSPNQPLFASPPTPRLDDPRAEPAGAGRHPPRAGPTRSAWRRPTCS